MAAVPRGTASASSRAGGTSRSGTRSGGGHSSSSFDGGDAVVALVAVVAIVGLVALIASSAAPAEPFDGWLRVRPEQPLHMTYAGGASRVIALKDLRPSDLAGLVDTRIDAAEGFVEELDGAPNEPATPAKAPREVTALNTPVSGTPPPGANPTDGALAR